MAQVLGALVLAEDPGLAPSTHKVTPTIWNSNFKGSEVS